MAMLAEPRRKQKWSLNPRGKQWSDDSNKFGQKMLEKMGWSSGKGLGANLDGMTEHIRLKFKNDQAGVGFSQSDLDKQWTQHQHGFNELLAQLHNGESTEKPVADNELSGKSLELKSKQSRARVHYQKFTRGKDVNKYSSKDLANIFGKRDLSEKAREPEKEEVREKEEAPVDPVGTNESSHGVVTIKGGSISDYFKNKMSTLGKKPTMETQSDAESESEARPGFGFSQNSSETPKKPLETHFSFVNPALKVDSPMETRETPNKRIKNEFAFENPGLDLASPKETPRKRKSDFVFDNPALEPASNEVEHTPKKRKSDFAFENPALDLETPQSGSSAILCTEELTKKKRKKKVKEGSSSAVNGFTNEALDLQTRSEENSTSGQFEVARPCFGLANDALDLTDETNGRKRVTFNEVVEYDTLEASGKRKKKKNKNGGKLDKFEVDNEKLKRKKKKERNEEIVESVFVNEALDEDPVSQEVNDNTANERKSERAQRKRDRRRSNLETIAEAPEEAEVVEVVTLDESLVSQTSGELGELSLEAPRKKKKRKNREHKENIAEKEQNGEELSTTIDISEELNDTVDISTPDCKEKKLKRKKTKNNAGAKVEEMEVEVQQEILESGKKEKKKKKKCNEESKENVDTENVVNVESSEEPDKKSKGKKERKEVEDVEAEENPQDAEDKQPVKQMENTTQSPWDGRNKKSKKSFKALFARSPVVNFVGSNINEIKGYGVDYK